MPYTKIVWIKLFLSLLTEDDRFLYQLNESQQLLYIKLLMLAGMTKNNITKNSRFICHKLNYHHEEACFLADIHRIKEVFPRFKEESSFYYFEKFEDLHNWVTPDGESQELQRNSKGTPKVMKGSVQIKTKNKNKIKNKREEDIPLSIKISTEERRKLVDNFGEGVVKEYVARLHDYAEQFPERFKKYKSHAATIRNWMRRDGAKMIYRPPADKRPEPCDPKVAAEGIKKLKEITAGIGK